MGNLQSTVQTRPVQPVGSTAAPLKVPLAGARAPAQFRTVPRDEPMKLRDDTGRFRFELPRSFLAERDHKGVALADRLIRVVTDRGDVPAGVLAVEYLGDPVALRLRLLHRRYYVLLDQRFELDP